ncbi:MAG: N-acetyl-alpha-D-glucosaminyl L-malate synthase BshA [Planctomycetota bacterium]
MSTSPERPLSVGILCYPTFGGSGVVAVELAQGLAQRGHTVHLFSYAPPARHDPFDERLHLHEVAVSSYPLFRYPPYDLALTSRVAEVAEDVGLDLIHAHYAIPHAMAALAVKDMLRPRRVPVVTTLHGTDITVVGQDPSYTRVTRYALSRSDRVTCVSQWLAAETRRVFGIERHLDIVPNFVDGERFRPARPSPLRGCFSRGGESVLMHVSNFRPVKQTPLVVDAFAQVAAERPATLVMVGDGPDRAACEARVQTLGLRSQVRFLGAQSDVENLLPAADLFLLPSRFESFGLAALEAMACGAVPLATAAGGLPEVIEDGVTGRLVPPEELSQMGRHALELLAQPDRLAAMSAAARDAAVTRFAREPVVRQYEALYRDVLASGSRRHPETAD